MYLLTESYQNFCRDYETEEACEQAFFEAKWPDGFRCTRCSTLEASVTRTRRLALYECKFCGHQSTVISDTVFARSRTPLKLWLRAMYLHSQANAIPATQLSEILGVTYKTAWLIGHKLRHAMGKNDASQPLSGTVRVNIGMYMRARIPGFEAKCEDQSLWVAASLTDDQEPEYIKIKRIPDEHLNYRKVLPAGVQSFISGHVAPGTSDLLCVNQLAGQQRVPSLSRVKIEAGCWLKVGFWGGIGPKHLQAYLNQFCFYRNTSTRSKSVLGELFRVCAATPTVTYSELVGTRARTVAIVRRTRQCRTALGQTG